MPRLLILSPVFPPARGGIETLGHRLALELGDLDIEVITLDAGTAGPEPQLPFPVRRVENIPRGGRRSVLRLNAVALQHATRHAPDVVLSLHVRASLAAALSRKLRGIPFAQYVHAKELLESPAMARFALQRAQAVVAVSQYARSLAIDAGAEPALVNVVPNGVDPAPPRRAPRDSRPTIVTVSRLEDDYKGHDVLLRALPDVRARVPDIRWVVIGEGSLRTSLQEQADAAGLGDAVTFVGAVDDDQRDRWLERAWAFVMPTRLPGPGKAGEGFGIVFLEAAARGLPVVAGRVPGVIDAVVDGETGLLVDPVDPSAVAAAVVSVLTNRSLAARLGQSAERRASAFAWPNIADQVRPILMGLIARGASLDRRPDRNRAALIREVLLPARR